MNVVDSCANMIHHYNQLKMMLIGISTSVMDKIIVGTLQLVDVKTKNSHEHFLTTGSFHNGTL